LELSVASTNINWKGVQPAGGAVASPATQKYTFENCYTTINRIAFGDDLNSSYTNNLISTGR
jgi:hypothetical protein